ncbi:hypothetical protein HZS55_13010 [Halosimplex rubrum]|uniref:Restriction endonuclease n=1 Tax=Halosimplex rubrum TaxID=869889 RepID=A0A7D5T0M8_9EURY|nr:hypothetical protein [Halosimplex rubrum]QLH78168.1 hypothetical protein HZS55_13010 [Halosimplex rubrum]
MLSAVTEDLRSEAQTDGISNAEDYDRSPSEREFDRLAGELGELAFARFLEEQTNFAFEHLGGKTECDFNVEGVEIDVKTRTEIDDNKRDLIVPTDLPDGLHDMYILLRCVYDEDEMDKQRHKRSIQGIEVIQRWDKETVEEKGEAFNPPQVQGRASENYRDTVIVDFEDGDGLLDVIPTIERMVRETVQLSAEPQAQPAD